MRELIFRLWDEKYNCWDTEPFRYYPEENLVKQGRVIQQYTGLKDQKDKMIFEGDLVSFTGHNDVGFYVYREVSEVYFEDGTFWLRPASNHTNRLNECLNNLTVVGHIFENRI